MMRDAYTALADWFEYLNSDCDYEQWSQYLYRKLKERGIVCGKGLDIGCGSGAFTRRFARMGFSMTGYDASEEMLAKAERLNAEEGIYPRYVLSDARRVRVLGGQADFALCVNDCLNYIPPADLPAVFGRVSKCLRRGGVFLFDVSSPHKLRDVIGNNVFCEDRDEVAYMWFNKLFEDRVEMEITLFARQEDGRFCRGEERHVQYIHEEGALLEAARGAGFAAERDEDDDGGMRLRFVCERKKNV